MAAPAQRYVPEPLNFAVRVLESLCSDKRGPAVHNPNPPFTSAAEWLNLSRTPQSAKAGNKEVQPLSLTEVLTRAPDDAYFGSRAFQCKAVQAAVEVVSRAADVYAELAALPEALAPAERALAHVAGFSELPQVLFSFLESVHDFCVLPA